MFIYSHAMSCQRKLHAPQTMWTNGLKLVIEALCIRRLPLATTAPWGNRNRLSRKVKNAWEIAESICRKKEDAKESKMVQHRSGSK